MFGGVDRDSENDQSSCRTGWKNDVIRWPLLAVLTPLTGTPSSEYHAVPLLSGTKVIATSSIGYKM